MKKLLFGLVASSAFGVLATSASAANILSNGDFELSTPTYNAYGFDPLYQAGAVDPKNPDWVVTGSVDLIKPSVWWPGNGSTNALSLSGTPGPGLIEQTVFAAAGNYTFSFDYYGNAGKKWAFNYEIVGAGVGPTALLSGPTTQTESVSFSKGSAGFVTVRMWTTAAIFAGPFVDNIDLDYDSAVPEPATMAVLGFGALGLLRRRNRKA